MKKIIVTGIGTNIGKTLVAAILTEYLNAYYEKDSAPSIIHYD